VLYQTEEEYYAVIRFITQSRLSTSVTTPNINQNAVDKLGRTLDSLSIEKGKELKLETGS